MNATRTHTIKKFPIRILNFLIKGIRSVLGGNFLKDLFNLKVSLWIVIFILTGVLYIFNSYLAEKKAREIYKLKPIVKELDYEYKKRRTERRNLTKQSTIAIRLKNQGIYESTTPPDILTIKNPDTK